MSEQTEQNQKSQINKKTRKRPRTKAVRLDLKNKLETAILAKDPAILSLFMPQPDNTLKAGLASVLQHLQLDGLPEIKSLTSPALKSISNVTRVFLVTQEGNNLWITINNNVCAFNDDKTVYVDNLPSTCNQDRLKRRAQMFGSVVSVMLPQILRIQSAIGSFLNSGFAFIQFASKTAAKRFCRRYATNSRLKRHNHKRKHASKMKKDISIERGKTRMSKESKESPSKPTKIGLTDSNCSAEQFAQEDGPADKIDTVMEDSGNETENDVFRLSKENKLKTYKLKKQKNRHRKRKSQPKDKSEKPTSSLTRFLHRIQVFSLKQYKELRSEYIKLKKEKMGGLKKDIANFKNKSCYEAVSKHVAACDGKKRRRGKQIVQLKAEKIKEACLTYDL